MQVLEEVELIEPAGVRFPTMTFPKARFKERSWIMAADCW